VMRREKQLYPICYPSFNDPLRLVRWFEVLVMMNMYEVGLIAKFGGFLGGGGRGCERENGVLYGVELIPR